MHREVLTKQAAELFRSLSRFPGFYPGGTAIALQIGHAASIAPLVNNSDDLTVLVDDVKITLLKYPFPTFDPFVIYEHVPLLSVREIAATKV